MNEKNRAKELNEVVQHMLSDQLNFLRSHMNNGRQNDEVLKDMEFNLVVALDVLQDLGGRVKFLPAVHLDQENDFCC
jgi:hypothetical protein